MIYFPEVHFNIIFILHLRVLSGVFPSGFLTKIENKFIMFTIRATCPIHLIIDNVLRTVQITSYSCPVVWQILTRLSHRLHVS